MTTSTNESIIIRPFLQEDKNFILASWLRGLFYGGSWFSEIPKDTFMRNYHDHLERLLVHKNTDIRVACLASDPDVIIGYAVFAKDQKALHWIHIKNNFRKIGISKSLVSEDVKTATHANKVGLVLIKNKGWVFNPFIV